MRQILLMGLGLVVSQGAWANSELWSDLQSDFAAKGTLEAIDSERYNSRKLSLEESKLRDLLNTAPMEPQGDIPLLGRSMPLSLDLPLPSGDVVSVTVVESPIMAPALAAEYPNIKTWKVTGSNGKVVSGRLDFTGKGFHGMLTLANGDTVYIEPEELATKRIYHSLSHSDNHYKAKGLQHTHEHIYGDSYSHSHALPDDAKSEFAARLIQTPGNQLKTVRLAVAAAGEFTEVVGGTKEAAMSAITTIVNRANEIYQRDVAVKLELVANNSAILYEDKNTDPYSAQLGAGNIKQNSELLKENQETLDRVIKGSNYDVGQVFSYVSRSTSSGLSTLGSVCRTAHKAQAVSGFMGDIDVFAASMFAHELAHQFSATHSFNSNQAACKEPDGRSAGSSWEPGGGSTIMSYAGVCGSDNLQAMSDPFFHGGNIKQIRNFVEKMSCGLDANTVNSAPVADAGKDYTVPARTPLLLAGTATDKDGDALTYSWEQYNASNTATPVNVDNGKNAVIRALPPTQTNLRAIPTLPALYSAQSFPGDMLLQKSRKDTDAIKMLLVVRDQKSGVDIDEMKLTVHDTGSPFKITSHTSATEMAPGSSQTVTWDVAGTDQAPISCSKVSISLAAGDASYGDEVETLELLASTGNDGSATVKLPTTGTPTSRARFVVGCVDNIFGALSPVNLSIGTSIEPPAALTFSTADTAVYEGNFDGATQMKFKVTMSPAMDTEQKVQYTVRHGDGISAPEVSTDNGDFFISEGGLVIPGSVPIYKRTRLLTFAPGQTTAYAVLNLKSDKVEEADEKFRFQLHSMTGKRLSTNIGTIMDDDAPPRELSISNASLSEADAAAKVMTFIIGLDKAPSREVSVEYQTVNGTAIAGKDFEDTRGTLSFSPFETGKTITVKVLDDMLFEAGDETFTLALSKPSVGLKLEDGVATLSATGVIKDNDIAPKLQVLDAVAVTEGDSGTREAIFTVELVGEAESDVSVKYATKDGTATVADSDYTSANGSLTFKSGETKKTVKVVVNGDTKVEGNEAFSLTLSDATVATILQDTATVTITNDEIITASAADITKAEGSSATETDFVFTVKLSGPATKPFSIDYTTVDGSATVAAKDYIATAGTLNFAVGESSKTVTVKVTADSLAEDNESFSLKLSKPTPSSDLAVVDATAIATINNDDDHAIVDVMIDSPKAITEGNTGSQTLNFTVTLSEASTQTVTVDYQTVEGSAKAGVDFTAVNGTLTFKPNETSKTISVKVMGDTEYEVDESFSVKLSKPTGAATAPGLKIAAEVGNATISNDDSNSVSIADVSVNEGAKSATLTLTLAGTPNEDLEVSYQTALDGTADAGDITPVSATKVVFKKGGAATQTIMIPVTDDEKNEGAETFSVMLSAATPASALKIADDKAVVTIIDNDTSVVSIAATDKSSALEGNSGTTDLVFTVNLSTPAVEDIDVTYKTEDGSATVADKDYSAESGGVITIAKGQTSGEIVVKATADSVIEKDETLKVVLTGVSPKASAELEKDAAKLSAQGTIRNDDIAKVSIADITVMEEGFGDVTKASFGVTLDQASTESVSVDYMVTDATAKAGEDYAISALGTLTFAAGETSKSIVGTVTGDWFAEGDETFTVTLSKPSSALTIAKATATATIKDNDTDTNSDGISDKQATDLGLDPAKLDSDADGKSDVDEVGKPLLDANNDGVLDAKDSDKDGVIDALESGDAADSNKSLGLSVSPEKAQSLGLTALEGVQVSVQSSDGVLVSDKDKSALASEDSLGGAKDKDYEYPYGLFNINVEGLSEAGASTEISLAYPVVASRSQKLAAKGVALDPASVLRVRDVNGAWHELSDAKIDPVTGKASFTITDGGPYDLDGSADQAVSYTAGIAKRVTVIPPVKSSGGGAIGVQSLWFLAGFALLISMVRRRKGVSAD